MHQVHGTLQSKTSMKKLNRINHSNTTHSNPNHSNHKIPITYMK